MGIIIQELTKDIEKKCPFTEEERRVLAKYTVEEQLHTAFQIDCECEEYDYMYSSEPEAVSHSTEDIDSIMDKIQGLLVYQGLLYGIQITDNNQKKNFFIDDIIYERHYGYDSYGYGSLLGVNRYYRDRLVRKPFLDKDK